MAYDPELNLLYIGTGNGSPWNREIRSPEGGDNLYLSSIVALNPDNGKLVWYYQTTPGDSWNYTATQPIILADFEINGVTRKILMQAPKNGFFYVIDRTSGEFISAKPYVYVNWAKEVDSETGRPIETSFSRFKDINAIISPHTSGGHNWHSMAYNQETGLVYIPAREGSKTFGQNKNWEFFNDARSWNTGMGFDANSSVYEDSLIGPTIGKLIAWDPIKQKEVWSVERTSSWNGGVLSTSDLVFQGTGEGDLVAYEATTGKQLWSFPLQTGIVASPITYMVDGVQYITIVAGWGGGLAVWVKFTEQINPGAIYTFKIGGKENKPEFPTEPPKQLVYLDFDATTEQLNHGGQLFDRYCSHCHVFGRNCNNCHGDGVIPNLSYSSPEIFKAFHEIVGEGMFLYQGMPKYNDRLTEQDITDIKNYILSNAKKIREDQTNGNNR